MDKTEDNQQDETSLAQGRTKREKKDKHGRFAALARLKKAKETGEKLKYEVVAEHDVYEEVDEKEYAKIVQGRQEDDWIIDDDGCGYVEDGREIFDEDLGDADVPNKAEGKGKGKKRQNPNIRAPDSKPKSIKSMFAAAAVKPKKKVEKDIDLNEDAILGDIMSELHQGPNSDLVPASIKLVKKKTTPKVVANPFASKATPKRRNPAKIITPRNVSSEIKSVEMDVSPPSTTKPPVNKPPVKRRQTALDKFDDFDFTPDITEFSTQETGTVPQSQAIEDPESEKENGNVDVSDINFEDDFSEMEGVTDDGKLNKVEPCSTTLEFDELMTSWETAKGDSTPMQVDVEVDSSKLPLTTNEEGEQVLRLFWLDAYEDQYKQPGVVYLFGKVWIDSAKTHVSCCVAVKNIERMAYLLPRKTRVHPKTGQETETPVTFVDVYQEFNDQIAEKYRIMKFKSMKSVRKYAFDKADVPVESEYLVVKYSADYPALPKDLKGETFSCVFGAKTSSLETLLLERKMKGPSWIEIKLPQMPNPAVSWCKVEAFVSKPEHVTVMTTSLPLPPLVVMTMSLKTLPNPKSHQNEVISVAGLVQHQFNMDKPAPKPAFQDHFCAITKPNECVFPYDFKEKAVQQSQKMKVDVMGNERALLGFLLAKIHKIDPDIIVGHDALAFDVDVLLHRISSNKIPHWSRMGRLKRANLPKLSNAYGSKNSSSANATCGRLVCDVKLSAKEVMRCRSYDLSELVSHILKEKRVEVEVDQIKTHYSNSQSLLKLIELILVDATFILRIMYELNVIPLALQITNICGNVMARTLMGGRAERNEYLLLHAFTEKGYIVPDKEYGAKKQVVEENEDEDHETTKSSKTSRRKPAYAGGLVLDPKKGFYDKYILLLDFNSLYPTIIQEFNICFTTISRDPSVGIAVAEGDDLDVILPEPGLEPGILPTEIRKLVQSRRQVKALMKQSDLSQELYMQYDIRQMALKLTANSMYGCLGFSFSRFYAKPLAALVTGKGREILMQTRDLVQAMNLEVIYGDTDSIMVNSNSTDLDHVYKLGNKVKAEVNKMYRLLEIDIDGVFKSMLLLKKKKYAALTVQKTGDTVTYKEELKGLDIVRRDWCLLAKQAGEYAVKQILSGQSREIIVENIHNKLTEVGEQVKSGTLPVELYHITKSLTKNPEDYPDKKSLPHVQVALRMNSKGGKKLCGGDIVYYVICEDGSNLAPSQRGYHPEELAKREDLTVDTKYYLAQQILPVVSRLCDPIDGTDQARIAECLGLDPAGYRQSMMVREGDQDDAMLAGQESDEEKYKNCDRFKFSCPPCGKEIIFDGVFSSAGQYLEYKLGKCPNADCKVLLANHAGQLMNKLTGCIREHIKKYYEGWLKCEDSACGVVTRKVPQIYQRGHPVCTTCQKGRLYPEYSDGMLYRQLSFYLYVFDVEKAIKNLDAKEIGVAHKEKNDYEKVYTRIQEHIKKSLNQSAYSEVSLARLFEGLMPLK